MDCSKWLEESDQSTRLNVLAAGKAFALAGIIILALIAANIRSNGMAEFIPKPGYENCGKCGGWQWRDKTVRDKNGWPIGPVVVVECDNCAGAGEIKSKALQPPKPIVIRDNSGLVTKTIQPAPAAPISVPTVWAGPGSSWGVIQPTPANPTPPDIGWGTKPLEPGPIAVIEPPVETPADAVAEGWAIFDKDKEGGS